MKVLKLIPLVLGLMLLSCKGETSLQEYYVENQGDTNFVALDIPASLVLGENSVLSEQQRKTVSTIKKINLLGYPDDGENKENYEQEKLRLQKILSGEKYQMLMKIGSGSTRAEFYYLGEEDAIDELIVFGTDENKGFGVARVLGEDMDPEELVRLFHSVREGELNLHGLEELLEKQ